VKDDLDEMPRNIGPMAFALGVLGVFVLHTMWACFVYRDQRPRDIGFQMVDLYTIYLPLVLAYVAFRGLLQARGFGRLPASLIALLAAFASFWISTVIPTAIYGV
jgi:predicted membrane channel-forming protein YqfA (hemolysin III family)